MTWLGGDMVGWDNVVGDGVTWSDRMTWLGGVMWLGGVTYTSDTPTAAPLMSFRPERKRSGGILALPRIVPAAKDPSATLRSARDDMAKKL